MTPLSKLKLPLLGASAILVLMAIYLSFIHAPEHEDMGDVQRIFYFHVSTAWVAYIAFIVTFIASIAYIRTRDLGWDGWAFASAQLGVVFCTLAIITGSLFAKAVWRVYWNWDDLKLLLTLVLWLVFLSYLVLRANVQSRRGKATLSAVFSAIGMVCIPLSFAANRIWTTLHPTIISSDKGEIVTGGMVPALVVSVLAFTVLYVTLLVWKMDVLRMREKVEELKQTIGD